MQAEARDPGSENGGMKKYIFGGYANEAWRVNQGFFGTGSAFLFTFSKDQATKLRLKTGDQKALYASNSKICFGEKDLVLQEDVDCLNNLRVRGTPK